MGFLFMLSSTSLSLEVHLQRWRRLIQGALSETEWLRIPRSMSPSKIFKIFRFPFVAGSAPGKRIHYTVADAWEDSDLIH
jgi:hypothetical protein